MRRMTQMTKGLVAAMEDESAAAVPVEEVGNNAESLETDLVEVADDQAEAAAADVEVDQAVETAEALESIAIALESSAAAGGLDKNAARALGIAVDHMYKQVGIASSVKSMPALEQFGGASSRTTATTLALEGIGEQIKKIWEAIVAHVKKAIAWIKERYTNMFGAANKLERRAKALATRADSTNGTAKEKSFENERVFKSLYQGTDVKATAGVAMVKSIGTEVFKNSSTLIAFGESIATALESPEGKTYEPTAPMLMPACTDVTNPESQGFDNPGEGMRIVRSAEMPGGKAIIGRLSTARFNDPVYTKALGRTSAFIGPFNGKATAPSKTSLTTLTTSDASKIAETVADIASEIQGYKSSLDKLDKIKSRIVSAAEKISKDAKSSEEKSDKTNADTLQKIVGNLPKLLDQPAEAFHVYALNTGKAYCDYVELSLNQYK